jgi:hypothetical protein
MWPKTLILTFGFRPNPPADESDAFLQARLKCMKALPDYSHVLVSPDDFSTLLRVLRPAELRTLVQRAWDHDTTMWVEKSDIAKVLSVYAYGGLTIDSLDEEITYGERISNFRHISPLIVIGNNVEAIGGMVEPDTFACQTKEPLMLSLLQEIASRITSRYQVSRPNGAHFTICGSFNSWAENNNLVAYNIVRRTINGKLTCKPTSGQEIFCVNHSVSWANFNQIPKSWTKHPTFTKAHFKLGGCKPSPTVISQEQRPQMKRVKRTRHLCRMLDQMLEAPDAFSRHSAPAVVQRCWPSNGKPKYAEATGPLVRPIVAAIICSCVSSDQRRRYLDKLTQERVACRATITRVKREFVRARGRWTRALVRFLQSGGQRNRRLGV